MIQSMLYNLILCIALNLNGDYGSKIAVFPPYIYMISLITGGLSN